MPSPPQSQPKIGNNTHALLSRRCASAMPPSLSANDASGQPQPRVAQCPQDIKPHAAPCIRRQYKQQLAIAWVRCAPIYIRTPPSPIGAPRVFSHQATHHRNQSFQFRDAQACLCVCARHVGPYVYPSLPRAALTSPHQAGWCAWPHAQHTAAARAACSVKVAA